MSGPLRRQTERCFVNGIGDLDQNVMPSGGESLLQNMGRTGTVGCQPYLEGLWVVGCGRASMP